MNCHICGKQELVMATAHKECIENLSKTADVWKQEYFRVRDEVTRLKNVVRAYEILINDWKGADDERENR